jgi:hypothetical protein
MSLLFFCNMNGPIVEVFKTDITSTAESSRLVALLQRKYPDARINFDLDDCDKILRIKGTVQNQEVVAVLNENGYSCTVLE